MSNFARALSVYVPPLVLTSLLLSGSLRADEPATAEQSGAKVEVLPMPAPAERLIVSPCYRRSRYDVWQYYGVDRYGHFRPLVIAEPCGAYYLYNGRRFPWVTTHELEVIPWLVD